MKEIAKRQDILRLMPKNSVAAELGVYRGNFSREIVKICNPSKLYLVDLWDRMIPAWPSEKDQRENRIRIEETYRYNLAVIIRCQNTIKFLQESPERMFDFVYLDSTHTYDHVLSELIISSTRVKRDGLICGHDYSDKIGNGAIIRAVKYFCDKYPWEIAYLTTADNLNSYALRTENV